MKPGEIVYFQGRYKCRVVKEHETTVDYVALEGHESSYDGRVLTVAKENSFAKVRTK